MNQEAIKIFKDYNDWFAIPKGSWTTEDFKVCYKLYNLLTGQNRKDSGCSSCRRVVINKLRQEYKKLNIS